MWSRLIGGVSTSWIWVFSNGIIAGRGSCVVYGYGAISSSVPVSRLISADLPAFGGPTTTTCGYWPLSTAYDGPFRPRLRAWRSALASLILRLMSAWRCSVPLCLGMTLSISCSASSCSFGSLAAR
jgi:hypothetical protein